MPLHLDYRPKNLEELKGNDAIKSSLSTVLGRNDKPHAFLLHGPTGCGKTTIARIIALTLKCDPAAVYEYNSSNTRGIDTIREIDSTCRYAPLEGNYRVYVIDECHKLTNDAQNAFLKLLEDTPKHVFFILCTTEPEKLIKTIHTRCTAYQVKTLKDAEMRDLLVSVLARENVEGYPVAIINKIIQMAEGCPRQALVMLDSVVDITEDDKAIAVLHQSMPEDATTKQICQLLLQPSSDDKWSKMAALIKAFDGEPESARYAIMGYLSAVLLNSKRNDRVSSMLEYFLNSFMYTKKSGLVAALYLACKEK
jgi:DNA polymerase-3 subunit gamma/tau